MGDSCQSARGGDWILLPGFCSGGGWCTGETVETVCSWLGSLWGLANTLLGLFMSIRRLHDIGRSGWWWLMFYLGLPALGMWLVASLFLVPALLLFLSRCF